MNHLRVTDAFITGNFKMTRTFSVKVSDRKKEFITKAKVS
jgi:hypothetical protein